MLRPVYRRVARNSQWGAVWGGGAPSRQKAMRVWGRSPQLLEAGGSGGSALSARKFCIFLQK